MARCQSQALIDVLCMRINLSNVKSTARAHILPQTLGRLPKVTVMA